MSPNAKAVFIHIYERHNGRNNGGLVYCVRDGIEIALSKDQTARALNELIERGFLKVRRDSAFTLKTKEAREWTITNEALDGKPASKEFLRWQPKSETRSHQRDRQSHQCDSESPIASDYRVSVAPARPSNPETTAPQSHQRDTSSIPGWEPAGARRGVPDDEADAAARLPQSIGTLTSELLTTVAAGLPPDAINPKPTLSWSGPKFGDAARARRTARSH